MADTVIGLGPALEGPIPDGYGPFRPSLPPNQTVDVASQSGYRGAGELAMPSTRTATVERYYVELTGGAAALVAQAPLAAPYAALPVSSLHSSALFFVSAGGAFGPALGINVVAQDILRIIRASVNWAVPAGRSILIAQAHISIIQQTGEIVLPCHRPASDVALKNSVTQQLVFVGPYDIRGTDFNLQGINPAFDEFDFVIDAAVVDGGGNVNLVPTLEFAFEVWRGANAL